MKIAFAFLVHNEETLQGFQQFLTNYYSSNHHYFIHFDKKLEKVEFPLPNVHVVEQQVNAKWGKYSLLYSELLLLKASTNYRYNFLYFMDGMTVPIRPLKDLEDYLQNLNPDSCAIFDRKPFPACRYDRSACKRTKAKCIDKECTQYDLTPNNAPVYKFSQWVMLSRPFIDHLFSEAKWFADWIDFFKHTSIPDESFFQTLLMDSPFNETQVYENPMYTRWTDCQKYPTRKGGKSPCWLLGADHMEVVTSDKWFVRKLGMQSELREILYEEIQEL